MLSRLLPLIPQGGLPYTEAYAGALNVLLNRPPAPVEAINDLDGRLVNLFRVLQDRETYQELLHRLRHTPYARAEFVRARAILADWVRGVGVDPVTLGWALVVATRLSFGGKGCDWGTVLKASYRGMAGTTSAWRGFLEALEAVHERLFRVQIDQRDALDFLRFWDTPEAVHYVDPPYHPETVKGLYYLHNADEAHHKRLVETLLELRGAVVLSGYAHPVHAPLEAAGWRRVDFATASHMSARTRESGMQGQGAARRRVPRVESVWLNLKAQTLLSPEEVWL